MFLTYQQLTTREGTEVVGMNPSRKPNVMHKPPLKVANILNIVIIYGEDTIQHMFPVCPMLLCKGGRVSHVSQCKKRKRSFFRGLMT